MEQLDSHRMDLNEIWYFSIFRNSAGIIQGSSKSNKNDGYNTRRPIYIFDHISLNPSANEKNVSDKCRTENQNTHFVFSNFFSLSKIVLFMRERGKILYSQKGSRWQYGAGALHAGYLWLRIQTQITYNYRFSTATMVTRTRLNVTLYAHCLSCITWCDLFLPLLFYMFSFVMYYCTILTFLCHLCNWLGASCVSTLIKKNGTEMNSVITTRGWTRIGLAFPGDVNRYRISYRWRRHVYRMMLPAVMISSGQAQNWIQF